MCLDVSLAAAVSLCRTGGRVHQCGLYILRPHPGLPHPSGPPGGRPYPPPVLRHPHLGAPLLGGAGPTQRTSGRVRPYLSQIEDLQMKRFKSLTLCFSRPCFLAGPQVADRAPGGGHRPALHGGPALCVRSPPLLSRCLLRPQPLDGVPVPAGGTVPGRRHRR